MEEFVQWPMRRVDIKVVEIETTSASTQFVSPASLISRELPASQQLTAEAIAGPGLGKMDFHNFDIVFRKMIRNGDSFAYPTVE